MTKKKFGRPTGLHHTYVHDYGPLDSANRRSCRCSFCQHFYESMRPEQVWKHLSDDCKSIPQECQDQVRDDCAAADKGKAALPPAAKRSRSTDQSTINKPSGSNSVPSVAKFTPSSANVTPQAQQELDQKCLRAFVHGGIPFKVIEDPYVLDLLDDLRSKWKVPGTCTAW